MECVNHSEREASGACVYCGKLFCADCLVEVDGRMYCKNDISKVIDEIKSQKSYNDNPSPNIIIQNSAAASAICYTREKRMHWIYFLLIGWWLGLMAVSLIIPLFIPGLVPALFGYW